MFTAVCEIHSSVEVRISLSNNIGLRITPQPVDGQSFKVAKAKSPTNSACQEEKMMTARYLELSSRSYPPALGHHAQSWENP